MSETMYVIQETNFEYNDEYYYSSYQCNDDEPPGHAKKVFTSETAAREACDELNLSTLKKTNLGEYGEEVSCYLDEGYESVLGSKFSEDLEDCAYEADWSSLTNEQWLKLWPFVKLNFFQVYEVELVG